MDISKLVQHIAKTLVLRMVANLVFVRSHNRLDVNKIRRLNKKRAGFPPQPKGWGLQPEE